MSDTATRLAEALNDLQAELDHADTLITEQQNRIIHLELMLSSLTALLKRTQHGAA
jgi:hypothetical protein